VIKILRPPRCLSTWRLPYRLVKLFAFVSGVLLFEGIFALGSPAGENSALLLYGERGDLPAIQAAERRPETQSRKPLLINWQAGKRAGLAEQRVLTDAEVRLRPPGLWETHHEFILAAAVAIVLQAILIAALLVERFWRRKAEASLRESEARFRAMADTAPAMIWMSGMDKLCTFFKLLVPERFSGKHPAYRGGSYAKPTSRAMGARRELFAPRKDGTEFPVEIGSSPIQTPEGMVVLCAVVDITERKQAEAEARKHRDELAHLSRVALMGEMAGSLAHELNQPLTGIVNNAGAGRRFIAKGRGDLQKLDSLLEAIGEDGRRAGGIIRGIRDMVQKRKHVLAAVNLNDVIASVLGFVRSDALERHCALVTEADPKLPLVEGDQVQLQQVLLNLIMNAFEAMGETPLAERRIIIRSERTSDDRVRVTVRDFGTGLSMDNPERIFEHFFSTKQNGLGMGLAIVRSIITSHDGELAAVNADGGGTCAYFSLPGIGEGDA
jgi:C4-dicarboxylate-specific signal transduction histidine kinase